MKNYAEYIWANLQFLKSQIPDYSMISPMDYKIGMDKSKLLFKRFKFPFKFNDDCLDNHQLPNNGLWH